MAFKNIEATKRLQNIINGGNDSDFLETLNDVKEKEKPATSKSTKNTRKKAPTKRKTKEKKESNSYKGYEIEETLYQEDIGVSGLWKLEVNKMKWDVEKDSEYVIDIRKWKYNEEDARDIAAKNGISLSMEVTEQILEKLLPLFYDME